MENDLVIVVGGPGGSGSSTIAGMLSEHFGIERIYGGGIFRDIVKEEGYSDINDLLSDVHRRTEVDINVDTTLREYARRGGVLIESKVFGALASKEGISCTVKIWLTADINTRARRRMSKENIHGIFKFLSIKKDLRKRYEMDRKQYLSFYGIQYDTPELYNDIVLDTSKMDEKETFYLILKMLEDGGYIKGK